MNQAATNTRPFEPPPLRASVGTVNGEATSQAAASCETPNLGEPPNLCEPPATGVAVLREGNAVEPTQSQAALVESERRFRGTFDDVGVGLGHIGPDGEWLRVNARLGELAGVTASRLLLTSHVALFDHADRIEEAARLARLMAGVLQHYTVESRHLRGDGREVWLRWTLSVQRCVRGCPLYAIAAVDDVSAWRAAEDALAEAHADMSQLLIGMEHLVATRTAEVEDRNRTLRRLALELSAAEHRERRRVATALHEDLQQILVAARYGLARFEHCAVPRPLHDAVGEVGELLAEALAASRTLSSELNPPVLEEAGLAAALRWLARHFGQEHGLSVNVEVDPAGEPADRDVQAFLFQSVRELLFNVQIHAKASMARVTLCRTTPVGAPRACLLSVEDDGCGCAGTQLADSEHDDARFGLFNIRHRLDLLGGAFAVQTGPGRGFRVTLSVPIESLRMTDGASGAGLVVAQEPTPQPTMRKPVRVIIADDHRIVRAGLAGLLRDRPEIQVVGQAVDGLEAVELATRLLPDVVIMDITMPRLGGIEATRLIHRDLPTVRVVGLSMHESDEMQAAMTAAGAAAYVTKGGPPEELIAAILQEF